MIPAEQGGDKYQQAYYVYEELAQAPTSSSPQTLVGQAVAELHLGRLEEAQVALQQALEKNPNHAEALANSIVLSILAGKEPAEHLGFVSCSWTADRTDHLDSTLKSAAPNHVFLSDVEQKGELFDRAAAKYSARVGA